MKTESVLELAKKLTAKQKLTAAAMVGLLSIGTLGAMGELSGKKKGIISSLAETVGLKKKESINEVNQPQTAPQLSKEYIYAGSRMLAVEDYGIAQPNPTPTP